MQYLKPQNVKKKNKNARKLTLKLSYDVKLIKRIWS